MSLLLLTLHMTGVLLDIHADAIPSLSSTILSLIFMLSFFVHSEIFTNGVFERLECYIYTGWLKLKYHTEQNAISRQPCEIFIPKFLDLYGRDPVTILNFFKLKF